jgi:hypothetical protein
MARVGAGCIVGLARSHAGRRHHPSHTPHPRRHAGTRNTHQAALYNWIKATNTIRRPLEARRQAFASRAWEPLQNKIMELRKVRWC